MTDKGPVTVARFDVTVYAILPRETESVVKRGILKHHTGRATWPLTVSEDDIPGGRDAADAQARAMRGRPFVIGVTVDSDGVWGIEGIR